MHVSVSVILPIYNTPKTLLKRAVDSVLCQTYSRVELIIVDDFSNNEETIKYLESVKETDKCSVTIHRKQCNQGVSDSLNIGLRLATGDYYCRLDHDDYLATDYIEKMYQCAIDNNADMVVAGMKQVDKNGDVISTYPKERCYYDEETYPWMSTVNLARLIKRSIMTDNGIEYPVGSWTEDLIFTARVYRYIKKTAVLPYEGYVNFVNPESSSRSSSYYALKLGQIPLSDIKEIVDYNLVERHAFISGLMNTEMMYISTMLTLFSESSTRREIISRFATISRELKCSVCELRIFHRIVHPHGMIRILNFSYAFFTRVHAERLYSLITSAPLRIYYGKKYRVS